MALKPRPIKQQLESATAELASAGTRIGKLKNTLDARDKEIAKLKAEAVDKQVVVDAHIKATDEAVKQLADARALCATFRVATAELASADTRIGKLKNTLDARDKEIAKLKAEAVDKQVVVDALRVAAEGMQVKTTELQKQHDGRHKVLTNQLTAAQSQIETMQDTMDRLRTDLAENRGRIRGLKEACRAFAEGAKE